MFIEPMLLTDKDQPFSDPRYLYEAKFDGHRLLLSVDKGKTTLYTRHGTNCTMQYPELWDPPTDHDVILDGEVICINDDGVVDFEQLMRRFQTKKPEKIDRLATTLPVQFVVFDVLRINGINVQSYPLWQRKELLNDILEDNGPFVKIQSIPEKGEAFFEAICQQGLEGCTAKLADSRYINQRSAYWNKIINHRYQDIRISGYRKAKFGWMMMIENEDHLAPAGLLELGTSPRERKAFYQVSESLIVREEKQFVWLEPRIRARVKHRGISSSGKLRVPVFDQFIF